MFTTTFRTRSHEEFLALQAELTTKAKAGTLNADELSEAIGKYYDDGDYIDRSIGTSWILANPSLYEEVIPGPYRLVFLMNHLDRPYSSEVLICDERVLSTFGSLKEASTYVVEAYVRNGARNNSWIKAALTAGISPRLLYVALARRLAQTPAEDPKRNSPSPSNDFMAYGDSGSRGRAEHSYWAKNIDDPSSWEVPADSPWGICSYNEFYSLVAECADKAPHRVFEHWRKLSAKLQIDDVRMVLKRAIDHLQGIPGAVDGLLVLDQEVREDLLRKIVPTDGGVAYTKLMVHTLLSASNPPKLWEEIMYNLVAVNALTMYLAAQPILAEKKTNPAADWLDLLIQTRLQTAGYVIGKVQEGTYTDRRRQETRRQLFVETHDGSRYIPDRDYTNRRYYPSVGDEVIFNPKQVIRRLTPKVFTIGFTPVDANKRR